MGTRKTPGKAHHSLNPTSGQDFVNDHDSIPSDIDEDMWGEIPKYQYLIHKQELQKAKDDAKNKKN